jgi:hypothetical protein
LIPPFPHFDPFGTEFREPGRVSHPDPNRQLQRSFEFSPEFLASAREPGLNRSDTDSERYGDFVVRKSFNIPQQNSFAINSLQRTQRLSQCLLALMRQRFAFRVVTVV